MLFRANRRTIVAALSVMLLCMPGCVRRRMTVRTNPPGAMVYVDHQSIGASPASTGFVYYGTRQFEIVKDGYRTEKFLRKIDPPWYEWPVLDFVSETIWPFEKRDERVIDVELSPEVVVPTDALIRSGEELRAQATRGVAVGQPPTLGGPIGTLPGNAMTPEQMVIPRGGVPFSNGNPNGAAFGQPNLPGVYSTTPPSIPLSNEPSFFEPPPFSLPAANVAPGASFRQPVPATNGQQTSP